VAPSRWTPAASPGGSHTAQLRRASAIPGWEVIDKRTYHATLLPCATLLLMAGRWLNPRDQARSTYSSWHLVPPQTRRPRSRSKCVSSVLAYRSSTGSWASPLGWYRRLGRRSSAPRCAVPVHRLGRYFRAV
jgi:hypothetical protein